MAEFFSSGRAIDLILVIVAIEVAILLIVRARLRASLAASGMLLALLPGLLLLLALRAALLQLSWTWIASCLVLAFAAHLLDLRLRWRSAVRETAMRDRERLNVRHGGSEPRIAAEPLRGV